jgi:glyoxylase-like metal-dependent hydrolase (beta-lactamase superfamily II)
MTSRRWTAPLPINVYVVEHARGVVLFDTGQDRASVTEPGYFPGGAAGIIFRRVARFAIAANETLEGGLTALGLTASDVHTVVISHLHQDHIGGLPGLVGPSIVLSAAEMRSLAGPLPEFRGLLRERIEVPGLKWNPVEMRELHDPVLLPFTLGYDVFGDGSIVVLPTPGHTPGSVSMLVRGYGPPLLMVGDLTYADHLLEQGNVPGLGEKRLMRESARLVNELRRNLPGLVVLPAHDPEAGHRLARAAAVAR